MFIRLFGISAYNFKILKEGSEAKKLYFLKEINSKSNIRCNDVH